MHRIQHTVQNIPYRSSRFLWLFVLLTSKYWKPIPTMKLAVQLEKPATAMAEGLGPCENNSATMNHGMGPGPISKNATKAKIATMVTYDIHLTLS